ncbi:MAG: hypothetical protein D6696_13565 [Acidobacteria bacterium]|nr:MAG: hypothetical protein D6696_13565 [Acidobacteriota bacterium]
MSNNLCPGRERFLDDARDLPPAVFRRLVGQRARQLTGAALGPMADEDQRRAAEKTIEEHFEKINLEADFLPARFLRDGADRARAVCRISTPRSRGTGFLIARRDDVGVLMTNNHVLSSETTAGQSVAEFGFEAGMSTVLAAIQPERLFITDRALDFTIVACDASQLPEDVAPIGLRRNPATATRHERVNVIQHPRGRPKEVALHDNRVERVLDRVLRYRTDTEPGSSGSPVFDNDWQLVALHHAGELQDGGKALNEGIRISAIVAHLRRTLRESGRRETLREVLEAIDDTSPFLGFFDDAGLGEALEVEVPDFSGSPDFADVGVWNIEHFNDAVTEQRIEDVAEVVARLSMDVLGLVEVQKGAMDRLVASLASRGQTMGYELLDVGGRQDLAVLYDRDTSTVTLRPDLAERHRERLEARTESGRTAFPRPPLFAECRVADGNEADVRFLMLVVHLKAFGDAQSRARRRLAARLLAEIVDDLRRSEDLPVILGGDFNERLTTDVLDPLKGAPDLFALTADDATDDAISFVGSSRRSLIDHVIVSRDVVLGEISGDDAAIVRLDQSVRDFSDRVSDHVPIVFRMILRDDAQQREQPADETRVYRIRLPEGAQDLRLEVHAGEEVLVPVDR